MPKLSLGLKEWWPVYCLEARKGWNDETYPPAEFTDKEVSDIRRVCKEFADWQDEIAKRFGAKEGHYDRSIIEDDETAMYRAARSAEEWGLLQMTEETTEPWILMVVTTMGWGGTDVTFQEFSSEKRASMAAIALDRAIKAKGGGHKWEVLMAPK